ncbi:MAG: acyl-CoA dehydrogenase family protein [Solirubrobacterales bacterium]
MDRAQALDARTGAAGLAPLAREHAEQAERDRRLPEPLAGALRDSGLPRMLVPTRLGGGEVSPREMVEALEELAVADGSTAWCAMVSATAGYVSAYLEPVVAAELFGAEAVAAGVHAPIGQATQLDEDYLVTGRWPFASFSEHSDLLLGGIRTKEGPRVAVFDAGDVEIHDTWDVSGLRGTGSNDISVDGLRVPATHTVSLATPPAEAGPLYAFPVFGLLALGIGSVALGIARAAIDDLRGLAASKQPTGSRRRLAERPAVQADVARATAAVTAARALVLETVDRAWTIACSGAGVPVEERVRLRLAATHATRESARAVDLMYGAGGGTSIYSTSPLQRRFRDVHAATQHAMVAPATWELTGRLLLGLETDAAQL